MSVPNIPFTLTQAATEYGLSLPTTASAILVAAGFASTGLVSQLAGTTNVTQIANMNTSNTVSVATVYDYVQYVGSVTKQNYNIQIGPNKTARSIDIFNGAPWCKIHLVASPLNFVGCSNDVWFKVDGTNRGVTNTTVGTIGQARFTFSKTNGGPTLYEAVVSLNR